MDKPKNCVDRMKPNCSHAKLLCLVRKNLLFFKTELFFLKFSKIEALSQFFTRLGLQLVFTFFNLLQRFLKKFKTLLENNIFIFILRKSKLNISNSIKTELLKFSCYKIQAQCTF